jgi:predicted transcriptional regulator
MPFSPETLEEKPYNACIICPHIGVDCDGPNFLVMSMERWCEWVRLRKDYLKFSNAALAEKAEVSKVSIDRIVAGNTKDLRVSTMQSVTKALVNGSWGQYPCTMMANTTKEVYVDNPDIVAKCEQLQFTVDNLRSQHQAELEVLRFEEKRKIDFLTNQLNHTEHQMDVKDQLIADLDNYMKVKDRAMTVLGVLLAIALAVIVGLFTIDFLNPGIGFIGRN